MNLGIEGRKALVCGASKGLGRACAEALAAEGVDVTITGRTADVLAATVKDMQARFPDVKVVGIAGDITTKEGRKAALAACPAPDILINNAGGPPLGDWRKFTEEEWLAATNNNMVSGIMLIRDVIDGMAERRFGRIINITSIVVKMPFDALSLSVTSRLGLTGFSKSIAAKYIGANVTLNTILPEQFETDRLKSNLDKLADRAGRSFEDELRVQKSTSPAKRFGRVEEFGAVCAFYCSAHVGYMTGQNVLIDGGRYPGVF